MKEDIKHLKNWINSVQNLIKACKSKLKSKEKLIFMIGTTSNYSNGALPYTTPERKISNGIVLGSIVFSQTQSIILCKVIDGIVDIIFLDSEKKLRAIFGVDYSPLRIFSLKELIPKDENIIEFGNISSACSNIIKKSQIFKYKANDLTVDTTWAFLNVFFRDLSGKTAVIYGSGNIGFKLALKLIECGCKVNLISKDPYKYSNMVLSLNNIKTVGAISEISIFDNTIHPFVNVDVIIGCTNTVPVITKQMVKTMNQNGLIIDLGKGTIEDDAIIEASIKSIKTWRVDVGPMIDSIVSSSLSIRDLYYNLHGKTKTNEDFYLVSGGYLGKKYDVIVDNYIKPKSILGVCDNYGKTMVKLDKKAKLNIEITKNYLNEVSE